MQDKDKIFLEELLSAVEYVRKEHPRGKTTNWKKVKEHLQSKRSIESLRNHYRRLTDYKVTQLVKRKDDFRMGRTTIEQRVLNEIKKKRPLVWLMKRLDITEEETLSAVARLQISGYRGVTVFKEDDVVFVQNIVPAKGSTTFTTTDLTDVTEGDTITFAVLGDVHMGSKFSDTEVLNKAYDDIASRGITTVLNTGDISEGHYTNRPTSINDLTHIGFQEQLRHIVQDYPQREDVMTYFITGNHDYTHMRNGLANIGETIGGIREDMMYLGHNFARVYLHPAFSVSIIHPSDSSTKALSQRLQNIINNSNTRKSDMMFVGHYHKTLYMHYKGVHGYLVPSMQRETTFMQDYNMTSDVGYIIVTVKVANDEIIKVDNEFIRL